MKICDVKLGSKIAIKFSSKIYEVFVIATGKYNICIGWNNCYIDNGIGGRVKINPNEFTRSTIVNNISDYEFGWWVKPDTICDLLSEMKEYPDQVCRECKKKAPHIPPNQYDGSFVCSFCEIDL